MHRVPLVFALLLPASIWSQTFTVSRFRQGNELRWTPIHREAEGLLYFIEIAPNGDVVRIEKGS